PCPSCKCNGGIGNPLGIQCSPPRCSPPCKIKNISGKCPICDCSHRYG
ncbi:hypothetical protein NPIL_335771, partial [Nephila pilipes]